MKIEDVKIGMKVKMGGSIFTVVRIGTGNIIIIQEINGTNPYGTYVENLTPYIKQKHKRIPLSEMPQEEFDELLKLGYDVEYKKCCDGVQTVNGITMVTDDNWKTCKLCLGGNKQ